MTDLFSTVHSLAARSFSFMVPWTWIVLAGSIDHGPALAQQRQQADTSAQQVGQQREHGKKRIDEESAGESNRP